MFYFYVKIRHPRTLRSTAFHKGQNFAFSALESGAPRTSLHAWYSVSATSPVTTSGVATTSKWLWVPLGNFQEKRK